MENNNLNQKNGPSILPEHLDLSASEDDLAKKSQIQFIDNSKNYSGEKYDYYINAKRKITDFFIGWIVISFLQFIWIIFTAASRIDPWTMELFFLPIVIISSYISFKKGRKFIAFGIFSYIIPLSPFYFLLPLIIK